MTKPHDEDANVELTTTGTDGKERKTETTVGGLKRVAENLRGLEGTVNPETGEIASSEAVERAAAAVENISEANMEMVTEAIACVATRTACVLNIGDGELWHGIQTALQQAADDLAEPLAPGYEEASPPTIKITLKIVEAEDQIEFEVKFEKRKPTSQVTAGEAQMLLTDEGIEIPASVQGSLPMPTEGAE